MTNIQKALLIVLMVANLAGAFHVFPFSSLFNPEPIYNGEYLFHYYTMYEAKKCFEVGHHFWGYDPYFSAGYPCNIYSNLDNKLLGVLSVLSSDAFLPIYFKLLILFSFIISPFLLYAAALNFGLAQNESLCAYAISIFIWNAGRYPYIKIIGGPWAFTFSCFFSVYFISIIYRYYIRSNLRNYLMLIMMGVLLPLTHVLSMMIVAVPAVAAYLFNFKKGILSQISVILASFIVLISNSFWLIPFFKYVHYKGYTIIPHYITGLGAFWSDMFCGVAANSGIILFIFFIVGLRIYWQKGEYFKLLIFTSLSIWTLYLGYYGEFNKLLIETEPRRFAFAAMLSFVIPAATSFTEYLPIFYNKIKGNMPAKISILLFLIILLWPAVQKQIVRTPLMTKYPDQFYEFSEYLRNNTDKDARILTYLGPGTLPISTKYDEVTYYEMMLPIISHRELISSSVCFFMVKNGFLLNDVFNLGLSKDYSYYFDLFNIGYIATIGYEPKDIYKSVKTKLIKTIKPFSLYRVEREHDFFLKGSGKVESDFNLIKVTGASRGSIVLKYHWFENLRAKPELKIEKYQIAGDPVGFIKVYNGSVMDFVLYCTY